jgi:competence protein ComGC
MIMKKILLIMAILFMVAAPNRTTSQSIAQKPSQNDSTLVIVDYESVKRDTLPHNERSALAKVINAIGEKITGNGAKPK